MLTHGNFYIFFMYAKVRFVLSSGGDASTSTKFHSLNDLKWKTSKYTRKAYYFGKRKF